jgi:hypothetical protein
LDIASLGVSAGIEDLLVAPAGFEDAEPFVPGGTLLALLLLPKRMALWIGFHLSWRLGLSDAVEGHVEGVQVRSWKNLNPVFGTGKLP